MSWQEEMVQELKAAQNGEKTRVMKKYSHMTGLTKEHLYRVAGKYGYKSGRKKRADKGVCFLSEMQIQAIAGLIHTTRRERKGTIMPVKKALEVAEQNGIIDPGCISVSRLQELLRERGLNKKALNAPSAHTPMRSLHPNHVHFVDVSVCIQYYLKNKQLRIMREDLLYKNKWENFGKIKQKIYRYVLTDHFSHTIFVKYYIARGETTDHLFDFLVSAWERKENHKTYPFRGVPFLIMMDRGAANISRPILDFLDNLDIDFPEPGEHNPRRQGSVERAQNYVEAYFESALKVRSASCVDELNRMALDWCRHINSHENYKHTRFNTPRIQCWMTIQEHQLRECPDRKVLQDIFRERFVERLVRGDYSISFQGESFRVKHVKGIIPNVSKVRVYKKPFTWPEIVVEFNETEYTARPVEKVEGGFEADAQIIGQGYSAMPHSPTEHQIPQLENLAYGEDRKKGDAPFSTLNPFKYPESGNTEFMPKKSTPMKIEKEALAAMADREISMFELLKELSRFGAVTPDMNKAIRGKYGDSIPLTDRDALVEAMEAGALFVGQSGELRVKGEGDDTLAAAAN